MARKSRARYRSRIAVRARDSKSPGPRRNSSAGSDRRAHPCPPPRRRRDRPSPPHQSSAERSSRDCHIASFRTRLTRANRIALPRALALKCACICTLIVLILVRRMRSIRQKGMIRFVLLKWTLGRGGLFFLFVLVAHRWEGIPFNLHVVLITALLCAIAFMVVGSLEWF